MNETVKLTASDGEANDHFGYSVGISGDQVVVGAYLEDENGENSGSVYVYEKPADGLTSISQTQKVVCPNFYTNEDDQYGVSISMDGDYAIIGVPGQELVLVNWYNGNSWVKQARLTASDGDPGDHFGYSVSISGDQVVVGAYGDADNGSNTGSAYVFKKPVDGWVDMTETAKLTVSNGAQDDHFGCSVSISGDQVVVGADGDAENGENSGSAYVFEKPETGWENMTETAKLLAENGAADDRLGVSVDISSDQVVVGAIGDSESGINSGSAYVFEKPAAGWVNMTETAKLKASDGAANDYFGVSVNISNDQLVVGAHGKADNGVNSGSAYVFEKPGAAWGNMTETAKLTASDNGVDDRFGISVSISGDQVVVGAYGDANNGINSGSAYVYEKPETGWENMSEKEKLIPSDGAKGDWFGYSVSNVGNQLVVGAPHSKANGYNSGSAYFYKPCLVLKQPEDQHLYLGVNCKISLPEYFPLVEALSNCGGALTYEQNPDVGAEISESTLITVTVSDGNGNSDFREFSVIVEDNSSPKLEQPSNQTLSSDSNCKALLPDYSALLNASDNCSATLIYDQNPIVGTEVSGSTLVKVTVSDENGNSDYKEFIVNVEDNVQPTLDQPSDQTLSSVVDCQAPLPDYGTLLNASDNCSATLTYAQDPEVGTEVSGSTLVRVTVSDENGNSDGREFTVTVVDDGIPTLEQPSNQMISAFANCQASLPDYSSLLNVSDNCSATLTFVQSPVVGTIVNGTTLVRINVSDENGNSDYREFEVTVVDDDSPIPDEFSLITLSDECSQSLPEAPTATDNCGGTIKGTTDTSIFPIKAVGSTEIVWTFTDESGNSSEQTQQVVISGIESGVFQSDNHLKANVSGYSYQWLDCNNKKTPIEGARSQSFTPTESGSYAVEISNGTCNVISTCVDYLILGTDDPELLYGINIYPNPTLDRFQIDKGQSTQISIRVLDIRGKELMKKKSKGQQTPIDLSRYPSGMYQLLIDNGEKQWVRKVLKQ
ncbi:T9SS type A sorting domain-containing protein [Cytophagales bacterium RKSG123]|nr:T9SS type A sorting domain-containing protein [Xanthovirga aplysinae]